jgi:voltage-gated potassium channel
MKSSIFVKFIKRQATLLKIISGYLVIYILLSASLFLFEHTPDKDENGNLVYREGKLVYSSRCKSMLDAFWVNTVFLLSGFEDYGPKSLPGKIISFVSFVLGLCTVTYITGKIASKLVLKEIKEKIMRNNLSGHIAICNWNLGGERIVKEIHASEAEPEVEIIVISQTDVHEEQLRHRPEFEKVFFIRCDPSLHDGLKASRISGAKSVIILADPTAPDPDAVTAMIALAVIRLCSTEKRPHIVAEAIDHRKMDHLIDAGVDEIICSSDFEYGLIAQCSMLGKYGKLSQIYQELLTYSEDTNELYIIPPDDIPITLIGKNYNETCITFLQKRDTKNPIILVGLVRNGEVMLNQRNDKTQNRQSQLEQIQETDGLIIMAYYKPDLRSLLT